MMYDVHHEMQCCPYCNGPLNATGHVNKDITPKPGDLTFCAHCKRLLEFDEKMKLIKAPPESRAQISSEQLLSTKDYLECHFK